MYVSSSHSSTVVHCLSTPVFFSYFNLM
jgi:hypothetical protein